MTDGFVRKKVESLTLGEKLIKLRSQYRMSLAEIAKATRIQAKYLEALESGDYHDLPAEVYVRGFLRSYARYLGLEDDAFVKLYDKEKHIRTHLGKAAPQKERSAVVLQKAWVLTPRTLTYGAVILILGGTFAYLLSELRSFVAEPRLVITSPAPGLITGEGAISVTGETDAGAQVRLNGEAVFVTGDGTFRELLTLQPGSNTLRILATNRFDKTKEVVLTVENTTVPEMPDVAPIVVEVSANQAISQVTLTADGVVVWNGPWDSSRREMYPVRATLSLLTSTPESTLLAIGEAPAQPLGAPGTPEATYSFTRTQLENPKRNIQTPSVP